MEKGNAVEILHLEYVEVFQVQDAKANLLTQGPLKLYYSQEANWLFISVNDFSYGLYKEVPILASDHEEGAVRAYVLANLDGHYVIKVSKVRHQKTLEKFEAILMSHTHFAYKEGPDGHGIPVHVKEGAAFIHEVDSTEEKSGPGLSATQIVYQGGKGIRNLMIGSAEAISSGVVRLGNHLQANYLKKSEETEIHPVAQKSAGMLRAVTGTAGFLSTVTITALMKAGNYVAKGIETKLEPQVSKELNPDGTTKMDPPTGNLVHATIYIGISLWQGMAEALDIIREGVTNTASNLVAHRYGASKGELFRAGTGLLAKFGPGKKVFKQI